MKLKGCNRRHHEERSDVAISVHATVWCGRQMSSSAPLRPQLLECGRPGGLPATGAHFTCMRHHVRHPCEGRGPVKYSSPYDLRFLNLVLDSRLRRNDAAFNSQLIFFISAIMSSGPTTPRRVFRTVPSEPSNNVVGSENCFRPNLLLKSFVISESDFSR